MAGNDNYTKLLVHSIGADTSPSFSDSSGTGHGLTAVGNAQVDTAQSKFHGSSCLLDGTGDYVETDADHADFALGTGDFTIDFWIRHDTTVDDIGYFGSRDASTNLFGMRIESGTLRFKAITGGVTIADVSAAWVPNSAQWYHLAIVRNSTAFALYVDGSEHATDTDAGALPDLGADFHIGHFETDGGTDRYTKGWIDEFRLSKGIARWTSTFTVPNRPYTKLASQAIWAV